ncbi:uncharacterized protein LOC125228734 [Leguminivora glycinivorella]|uniref:uncharacterized protein LOC125228734 n=1 Tax=Leguminivora glycinivorella TaxID=1035111 RepID=UPI00200D8FAB|nr:uncharacterized protein LOC125228734 [Leguminivora glycinivorella]
MASSDNSDADQTEEKGESEVNMECSDEQLMVFRGGDNTYDLDLDRPTKRGREVNEEEIWNRVGRKAKRFVKTGPRNDGTTIPEDKIEVSLTCTEKLPKQFGLAKMLKAEKIQCITRIKFINAYKVLIHFNDEISADSLIQSKKFNENGFKCQRTLDMNQSYGVIFDVDLSLSESEIMQDLISETVILAVKRLNRRNTSNG